MAAQFAGNGLHKQPCYKLLILYENNFKILVYLCHVYIKLVILLLIFYFISWTATLAETTLNWLHPCIF